jgi:UDP-N-acetylglucosamine:LPS N-acetylglucosamine transferase
MRVLILFCEEGEGHASAARVLERDLAERGADVVVVDAMKRGLGRLVPLISRDAYRLQVRRLRWSYGLEYFLFTRVPPARWLGRRGLCAFASRPLRRLIRSVEPDIVVSTHPAVTNVLGFLRRRGRLDLPVVATITDLGVHPLWSHRGIDLHLVMHDAAVPSVEKVAGRGSAAVVAPIVAREFGSEVERSAARLALGFPVGRPLVLVSGGGWGVGSLERVAEAALAVDGSTVVCLVGRNELLRRRLERDFAGEERLHVVAFTTRMPEYLAAADVLVDSSVGVTCLEALRAGCAVVACGAPPGHSRDNARALARLGLAVVARAPEELPETLSTILAATDGRGPSRLAPAPTAAEKILGAEPRVQPRQRRRVLPATAAAMLGALVLAGWTFASPTPYRVVAGMLDLGELTRVGTQNPEVAVIVVAPAQRIPELARKLGNERVRVSFAVGSPPGAAARRAVAASRDQLLPDLTVGGARGVLHARTRLLRLRHALGLGSRFYYLAPPGFTIGDYVAARTAGGLPVAASARVQRGSILVVRLSGRYDDRAVTAAVSSLEARGLRAVPLSELLASRAITRPTGSTVASAAAPPPVASRPSTRPAVRSGEPGHHSWASTGASATGMNVVRAKTSGAT